MESDFDLTFSQDKERPISNTFLAGKKMIRIDDLQVFVQTAEAGSFSAAARRLDLTPALASSAVQRLERELGLRLLVRSTRSMRLSDEGARYLPHARAVLAALASGQEALDQGRAEIAGPLRLSVPSDLGRQVLLPWLDDFQAEHPRLQLQLRVSDRFTDLFGAAVDAGIRYGQLADSGLVSLPLAADNRRIACAAPSYLERHGRPATPAELLQHNCLRYVMGEHTHERWSFHLPSAQGGPQTVPVRGDRISDDGEVVRRWALSGQGIAYKSALDVAEDLRSGRLVALFPLDWGEPAPLQMVCPDRASLGPAIQRLRDFLVARCQRVLDGLGPG